MNPILSSLSSNAASKLAPTGLGKNIKADVAISTPNLRFFDVMSQKNTEKLNELASQNFDLNGSNKTPSVSAEDIQLSVVEPGEVGMHGVSTDKNTLTNLLSDMNGDLNRLDSMVDVLGSGTKLSQRDLSGMQVFMSKSMIAIETVTRGASEVAKAVNSAFNMQV